MTLNSNSPSKLTIEYKLNITRQKILDIVKENPGINVAEISKFFSESGLAAQYMIKKLEVEGKIGTKALGRELLVFPTNKIPELAILAKPESWHILASLYKGRLGPTKIAESIGVTRRVADRLLNALLSSGLVTKSLSYRPLYHLNWSARNLIQAHWEFAPTYAAEVLISRFNEKEGEG